MSFTDAKNCGRHESVYRYEIKYFINYTGFLKAREVLSRFMAPDRYASADGGYFVRSLYFDTPDNKDYVEKIMGIEKRRKIRLRVYGNNDENVKLEIKSKFNAYMKKETAVIARDQARRLLDGDRSFLARSCNPVLEKVHRLMSERYYMPMVVIDYRRDAFSGDFNAIRITFDHDIRSCASCVDLFSGDLHMLPVFDGSTVVMEVKYNHFLPGWIKMILSCFNSTGSAISKYCYGREACVINM
jgi:hypothetical protein